MKLIPSFHRPIFDEILRGAKRGTTDNFITGPRRVGKEKHSKKTDCGRLMLQDVNPADIIYYSMDNTALLRADNDHDQFLRFANE